MGLPQRAGADGDIPDPHPVDFFHHHIYDIIPVPEVMMEADRHSIPDPAFYQNVMYAVFQLASV